MHTIRLAVDATGNARCPRVRGDALYRPDRTERLQVEAQVLEPTGLVLPGITLRQKNFWFPYRGIFFPVVPSLSLYMVVFHPNQKWQLFCKKETGLLKRAPPGRRGRLWPAPAASHAPRQFLSGMSGELLPL